MSRVGTVEDVMAQNRNRDFHDIIKQVLRSPIRATGDLVYADGQTSMEELSHSNTDVQTRIVTQMAFNAAQGDVRSADFLMKYGGYELPTESRVTLNVPQIINDMSDRTIPVPPSPLALDAPDEDEDYL